jgi:hypothetical protein
LNLIKKVKIHLRNKSTLQIEEIGVDQEMERQVIVNNKNKKQEYDILIKALATILAPK